MNERNSVALFLEEIRNSSRDGNRSMLPPGAAEGQRQIRLSFFPVLGNEELQQFLQKAQKIVSLAVGFYKLQDCIVHSSEVLELGYVVRVGQESDVEDEIGIAWEATSIAETHHRDVQPLSSAAS